MGEGDGAASGWSGVGEGVGSGVGDGEGVFADEGEGGLLSGSSEDESPSSPRFASGVGSNGSQPKPLK